MKAAVLAALGFAMGIAFAHFGQRTDRREPTPAAVVPRQRTPGPTLRKAIEPVYNLLFGPLDNPAAIGVAIEETAELEKLLATVPADAVGAAAKRVGTIMSAARTETIRAMKSNAQPVSTALGGASGSSSFFGGVYEKRWRASMTALAAKAAPEWRRFVETDAAASCPPQLQSAISTLLSARHRRELERTAILIEGRVTSVFKKGALVQMSSKDEIVFVTGLGGVADDSPVRALAHSDGIFQYETDLGAKRTVHQFRFFRDVAQ